MKPFDFCPRLPCFVRRDAVPGRSRRGPDFPAGRPGRHDAAGRAWSGAKTFAGFETEDQSVKVLVAELPAEAYGEVVNAFKANPAGTSGIKPESIETAAGMAYYTAENAKNGATSRAALFDDPAGRHLLRLCRRAGSRERQQDLHRRGRAADVCLGDGPQGSSGRGAAWADAVQGQRPRRFQECPHAGARRRRSFSPTATKTPASRRRPSW